MKNYSSKYDSFWCCTGTGMQAPAKFGKMIYSAAGDTLFVNMFISSDLQWKDTKVSLTMETAFPATSPELTAPAGEVVASAERVTGNKKLRFQVPASVATREFSLEPYNGIHFCRYSVYFKDYSEED